MKVLHIACMVSVASVLVGCLGGEPKPQANHEMAQVCFQPKYTIVLGDIKALKSTLLPKDEFARILSQSMQKSHCFVMQSKLNDPKDGYVLNVEYNFEFAEVKEKKMLSSKDTATLKSEVKFSLVNPDKKIIQTAVSTTKMSGQKYLGVGESIQITQAQKENLVERSLHTIFTNLSGM